MAAPVATALLVLVIYALGCALGLMVAERAGLDRGRSLALLDGLLLGGPVVFFGTIWLLRRWRDRRHSR